MKPSTWVVQKWASNMPDWSFWQSQWEKWWWTKSMLRFRHKVYIFLASYLSDWHVIPFNILMNDRLQVQCLVMFGLWIAINLLTTWGSLILVHFKIYLHHWKHLQIWSDRLHDPGKIRSGGLQDLRNGTAKSDSKKSGSSNDKSNRLQCWWLGSE